MKVEYSDAVLKALEDAPAAVRKAFFKQVRFLLRDLHHPSLRAKKYDSGRNLWQGRVNRDWRFYFTIAENAYRIILVIPHPK